MSPLPVFPYCGFYLLSLVKTAAGNWLRPLSAHITSTSIKVYLFTNSMRNYCFYCIHIRRYTYSEL